MDDRLREILRNATSTEQAAHALREAMRADVIKEEALTLLAILGQPAARRALSEGDDWPAFMSRGWCDLLALLGHEACVLFLAAFGRYFGGDAQSLRAIEIADRWLSSRSPEERAAATAEAREVSLSGTLESWERLYRLLATPEEHLDKELWLLLQDEGQRADLDRCRAAVIKEVEGVFGLGSER